jgi:hypothetical protein
LSSSSIPCLDEFFASIIFVPGLRAGATRVWTHQALCWPQDLLPCDLPDARVIIYGYNEDAQDFFNPKSGDSIFNCSRGLLENLSRNRAGDAQVFSTCLSIIANTNKLLAVPLETPNCVCCPFIRQSRSQECTILPLLLQTVANVPYCFQAIAQSCKEHNTAISAIATCLCGIVFINTPHEWQVPESAVIRDFIRRFSERSSAHELDVRQAMKVIQSVTTSFNDAIPTQSNVVIRSHNTCEGQSMPDIDLVSLVQSWTGCSWILF